MSTITLQFDNYNDMIRFCKTVTQNCMYIPKEEEPIHVDYTQLDELSNDINNFVDDVEKDLEFETDEPDFSYFGKRQKQIVKLFWRLKIFSIQMVRFELNNKKPHGSYVDIIDVLSRMVRKNLLIQIDSNHYFVNPKVIDQKPTWLNLDTE